MKFELSADEASMAAVGLREAAETMRSGAALAPTLAESYLIVAAKMEELAERLISEASAGTDRPALV
jgi:hypothetical protein